MGIKRRLILLSSALLIVTIGILMVQDTNVKVDSVSASSKKPETFQAKVISKFKLKPIIRHTAKPTPTPTPTPTPGEAPKFCGQSADCPSGLSCEWFATPRADMGVCRTPSPTSTPLPTPTPTNVHADDHSVSGIKGKVFIGPTCPVVTENRDCSDRPYQTTLTILKPEGSFLKSFETDDQGHFHVDLAAGKYILHPSSDERYPHAADQNVNVSDGQFTYVEIHYDSGIRFPISICQPPECVPPGYCKDLKCHIDHPEPSPTPTPTLTINACRIAECPPPVQGCSWVGGIAYSCDPNVVVSCGELVCQPGWGPQIINPEL